MTTTERTITDRLRDGDRTALRTVYTEYRDAFLAYGRRFNLSEAELADLYQDAVIALFQNFVEKQTRLTSGSLKTYLFSIAKFKAYDRHKQLARTTELTDDDRLADVPDYGGEDEPTEEQRLLAKHFATLSASCQEILRLFYYRNWTVQEIVDQTDYKNANTVKAHKSRCMKTLSDRINQRQ